MSSDNETERRYLQLYWQERAKNERLKNALDEYGTIDALRAENARLREALRLILEKAHYASAGPAVPDEYWEIRHMAQEALEEAQG